MRREQACGRLYGQAYAPSQEVKEQVGIWEERSWASDKTKETDGGRRVVADPKVVEGHEHRVEEDRGLQRVIGRQDEGADDEERPDIFGGAAVVAVYFEIERVSTQKEEVEYKLNATAREEEAGDKSPYLAVTDDSGPPEEEMVRVDETE